MSSIKGLMLSLVVGAGLSAASAHADDWTGTLQPKPANAKDGVVAVLHTKGKDAKDVNLIAKGDTAKQLEDFAHKHSVVKVSGTAKDDGVHVDSVSEAAAPVKKKKAAK